MPIYEYECAACAHTFEVFQKISAPAPEACPECGAPGPRKLVSRTAFVLKGSGWYRDHYGLKSSSSSKGSSDSGSSSSSSSSSTTKAAAK